MRLLIQWIIGIVGIAVAVLIVPGIGVQGDYWVTLALSAVILGLANLTVRPILKLLTLPINVATLGLFSLVINGGVLLLVSWLSRRLFGIGLTFDGILTAILAAIVIGVVSAALNFVFFRTDRASSG